MPPAIFRITVVLIAVLAASTCAAQGGINLTWDDCGESGQSQKYFGCETNDGPPYVLFGSFYPPYALSRLIGIDATIDMYSSGESLPSWWTFGIGGCRAEAALRSSFEFELGPYTCLDVVGEISSAGHVYEILGPGRARIRLSVRWSAETEVFPDHEYYAFRLDLGRQATIGAGACADCETPVCLGFSVLTLIQDPYEGDDPGLTNLLSPRHPTFQNAWLLFPDYREPECHALDPVPVRHSTWGAVKALYR